MANVYGFDPHLLVPLLFSWCCTQLKITFGCKKWNLYLASMMTTTTTLLMTMLMTHHLWSQSLPTQKEKVIHKSSIIECLDFIPLIDEDQGNVLPSIQVKLTANGWSWGIL